MLVGEFLGNVGKWCENRWKNVGDLGWNSVVLWVLFC